MRRLLSVAILLALLLALDPGESLAVRPTAEFNDSHAVGSAGRSGDDDLPDKSGLQVQPGALGSVTEGKKANVIGPEMLRRIHYREYFGALVRSLIQRIGIQQRQRD